MTNLRQIITKASLSFEAKFWWVVLYARLRPTVDDNTLHPLQESLVSYIMSRYGLNCSRLIATEIRDRAFNERAGLPFVCLIWEMCEDARVPLSRFFDRCTTISKSTNAALIKDMDNTLYKAKLPSPLFLFLSLRARQLPPYPWREFLHLLLPMRPQSSLRVKVGQ